MANTKNKVQEWPIRNDDIVLKVLAGVPVKIVADAYKMTPQNVSKICNNPKAAEIVKLARAKFQEKLVQSNEEKLGLLSNMAVDRLKTTLETDLPATAKAKPNQDRVALKILEGRGFLKVDKSGSAGLQVPMEVWDKLMDGLKKSDEAMQIDPFEEAEFEVVEEENV